ncbi:DUF4097 family beta strand repeat-containing protein [Sediminibacillus albus]|uniref:DUF4097 and DUF4098 domain-containing protein YvlB n=1 Tax=Sediminibacillus albus TaxID=407036 RepID=A0A1G8YPJ5_9BACI|nr:DUF4097 family beta strand repeat-containing protein [Sediminibacillus albus]SDK04667.1 DUF4097 and DUF4098 domain-containing protein YvlB [Sediminibacillus albus]
MNEDRKKILKMIEDGIISSEEAEELLESLEQAEQAKQQSNPVSTNVDWEQEGQKKNNGKTKSNKKSSFFGFVEEAFQKIKNVDLDFNFGTHYAVSHIFHHHSADFTELDIDISNGNIELAPWNENDVRIECEAKVYQVDSQEKAREKFHEEAFFLLENQRLQFSIQSQQVKTEVKIRVPVRQYQKAVLKLFNGSISAERLTVRHFKTKTTNGSIDAVKMSGGDFEAETANGTVNVVEGNWLTLESEAINGKITVDGVFNKVEALLVNGSISCRWQDGNQPEAGFFKTTTGTVRLALPENVHIYGTAETKIGNIHCDLANYKVVEEKKDVINRSLQFEANPDAPQLLHVEAETKTGSIWVRPL